MDGPAYVEALERALAAIRELGPRCLAVCIGLDTALRDPTGTLSLRADDLEQSGSSIGALGLPTLLAREGGCATRTLGANAQRFVRGAWNGAFPAVS